MRSTSRFLEDLGGWVRSASRPLRQGLGLQFEAGYYAEARDLAKRGEVGTPASPSEEFALRIVRGGDEFQLYERRCRELNSGRSEFAGMVDRIAVAERRTDDATPSSSTVRTLIGYWCFVQFGRNLHDQGVYVAPAARGHGISRRLLHLAAAELADPLARVYVNTSWFNRSMNRVAAQSGLRLYRVSIGGGFPLGHARSLFPNVSLELASRSAD